MKLSIQKNARILALFAVACTLVVAIVDLLTKDTIAKQEQKQLLNTLHQLIPHNMMDNDMFQDCVLVYSPDLGSTDGHKAYIAKKAGKPVAVAISTIAPDGYNGNIELLVALKYSGEISGVSVLKHQETPGLGDKIEPRKSDWLTSFKGTHVEGENDVRWAVAKDGGMFDQFTGATITPRAVVKAVKKTAIFYKRNKTVIFSNSPSCYAEQP